MINSRTNITRTEIPLHERRRHQRLQCAVQIEVRVENTDVPVRLQTSDISQGGCYVEMGFALNPGDRVNAVLWLGDQKLLVKGVVVSSHPQFGNGIQFVDMTDNQRTQLGQFLKLMEPNRIC